MIPSQMKSIFRKLSIQQPLTESELQDIEMHFNEAQQTKQLIDGLFVTGSKVLNIPTAFEVITSQVLEQDLASLTVDIPSVYKHLFLMGAGRASSADNGRLYLTINDDSDVNYNTQYNYYTDASVFGDLRTSGAAEIGYFSDYTASAGESSSFFSVMPHISSTILRKNILSYYNVNDGATLFTTTNWNNINAISKIAFSLGAGNLRTGSTISVYGLR